MKIQFILRTAWLKLTNLFKKKYQANICGHKTHLSGPVSALTEEFTVQMPLADNGKPDYCLECIGKMSIRCAWCDKPIHIGEPITLYIPNDDFVIPKHAVRHKEALVGCLRWGCGFGHDRGGFWLPPGAVKQVPTPVEMMMATGQAVIVSNLGDQENLGKTFNV